MPREKGGKISDGIIYLARNMINGKCYIGQTTESGFMGRKCSHLSSARKGDLRPLYRAMRKYGVDNFEWEIIHKEILGARELDKLESYYIKEYGTKSPKGYNLTDGGEGSAGWTHSEEVRKKMRRAAKKRPPHGPHTEETKRKIGLAHKGKKKPPVSEETRAKLRAAIENMAPELKEKMRQIGRKNGLRNKGSKRSQETRERMCLVQKNRVLPPDVVKEQGRKISEANMDHLVSDETKKKISESNKKWWSEHKGESRWSEETRRLMSERRKKFYTTPEGLESKRKMIEKLKGKPKPRKNKKAV